MAHGNSEMKQRTTVTEAHDLNVLGINYASMSHHATLRYTGSCVGFRWFSHVQSSVSLCLRSFRADGATCQSGGGGAFAGSR